MGDRLRGRVAIVTGAGRGIGRGEALLLAEEGAAVVINDVGGARDGTGESSGPADDVVDEIRAKGGKAVANYDSVATMQGGENMVKAALDNFGRLDIVINNAGILRDRMVFNMSEDEWDAVIAVHLKGHFTTIRAASAIFRQQRSGRIVNTSSTSGLGNMGQINYSAAKEGIVGLTRTAARDLGKYGVTCNAIRPTASTRMSMSEEMRTAAERSAAAGNSFLLDSFKIMELMRPEYIAPLVVWLCTDAASFINGRTFGVGGPHIGLYGEPEPIRTAYNPKGSWTIDELMTVMPTLLTGVANLAPAEAKV